MQEKNGLLIKSMETSIEGKCFVAKIVTDRKELKDNDLKCCIYTDDYFLMCTDSDDNAAKVRKGTIHLRMNSRFLWLPGDYQLIFSLGDSLMGVMELEVDDRQAVHVTSIRPFEVFAPEDVASSLLASDSSWATLSTLPGTKELRLALIEANRMRLWSNVLNIDVKDSARQPSGYVFTCTGQERPVTAIKCFFEELTLKSSIEVVDSTTLYDATLQNPLDGFNRLLDSTREGCTICLDKVGMLTGTGGRFIVRQLSDEVRKGKYQLWLAGTRQEIDSLFNAYPSLGNLFPKAKRLTLLPPSPREMVHSFFSQLAFWDLRPTEEATHQLAEAVRKGCEDGTIANWSSADINRFYQEQVLPAYLHRLATTATSFTKDELRVEDIDFSRLYGHVSDYEECMGELNRMVGLDNVKKGIATIAHQVSIFAERRKQGLATNDKEIFHAVFTGSPGTGKTTVAKMLGRIFHHLGVLSKGEVITVDRSRIVGRFIGDTEDNVKNLLKEARGNVLFIDEAYTLYDNAGSNDYGRRAVESLLASLTDTNPDMLIIFAGYKAEMDRLMTMNPGLHDRFPLRFQFDDYSAEQLMQIAEHIFAQDEYELTPEARNELQASIRQALKHRSAHFGNARWVEQLVRNGIIPALANRLTDAKTLRKLSRKDYQQVEAGDVKTAYEQFAPHPTELKPRLRVLGFSA